MFKRVALLTALGTLGFGVSGVPSAVAAPLSGLHTVMRNSAPARPADPVHPKYATLYGDEAVEGDLFLARPRFHYAHKLKSSKKSKKSKKHKHKHKEGGEGGEGGKGVIVVSPVPAPAAKTVNCGSKGLIGTLIGAAAGGYLGSKVGKGDGQLAATAAGTLAGALLGQRIGESLDAADMACARAAEERAYDAPVGTEVAWENPQTGHYGTVTPVREGHEGDSGNYCREFQHAANIDGRREVVSGVACRQSDGTWRAVN